jgi:hypothetical protein
LSHATNEKDSRLLWERGLQFLGGQTASQAHEITNVLNIINEMVGLMGDLLYGAEHGRPLDPARLVELTQKVAAQVQRGNQIVRAINQFGHSADVPRAVFDLKGMLERIAFIAQRPATLSKTRLVTDFPEQTISLENSPLGFQQAVFTAFQIALAASGEQRHITLRYALADGGVRIEVQSADALGDRAAIADNEAFLRLLVEALGGRVERLMEPDDPRIVAMYFSKGTDAD